MHLCKRRLEDDVMGIRLFGKNIFQIYKHHIMRINYREGCSNGDLTLCQVDLDHIAEELAPIGTTVTVQNLNRLMRKNSGKCEGFKLMRGGVLRRYYLGHV